MVRQIITQTALLREKSQQATEADRQAAQDLTDTLEAHREHCVGMAANMIGILKNIIAVSNNGKILVMYNPVIIRRDKPFETKEGCLSLSGTRPTLRYKESPYPIRTNGLQMSRKSLSDSPLKSFSTKQTTATG